MTDESPNTDDKSRQGALDKLRDRTDELELIISSLTIFALFSLPGWLWDKHADIYTHLSTSMTIAVRMGLNLIAGFCYVLGICFVVHLMARAYWVGLIGLRAVFPGGIKWNRTPGIGPVAREHYRRTIPDLGEVIGRTDRLASSLFAVISMLTLSVLWFGGIVLIVMVVSGAIGARFGLTNAGINIGALLLLIVFIGVPMLNYLLDAQLAGRAPGLRDRAGFRSFLGVLRGIAGLAYPQRLILPVQLTLQSNTRPIAFSIGLALSIVAIVVLGGWRFSAWSSFTLSEEFIYLDDAAARGGFFSTFYEDMSHPRDRIRPWPRLDSFENSDGFARLFLPYHPLRDNLVLDQFCDENRRNTSPVDCLRQLWRVEIDGRAVALDTFQSANREDLRMRGLIGLIPLIDLEPGLHMLRVVWNPGGDLEDLRLDDRYTESVVTFDIPLAFTPSLEMPLPQRAPASD